MFGYLQNRYGSIESLAGSCCSCGHLHLRRIRCSSLCGYEAFSKLHRLNLLVNLGKILLLELQELSKHTKTKCDSIKIFF